MRMHSFNAEHMVANRFSRGTSIGVTFLALVIIAPPVAAQESAKLTVVKTWKDLQNVPPIDIGGGVKIRLGLEAEKAPQWSGTLLYCLTEGYKPAGSGKGDTFGPVGVRFEFESEKKEKSEGRWGRAKEDFPEGSYLFARAFPMSRVGTYHVTVSKSDGNVIAKCKIEGTKDAFHPWMPWFYIREIEELAKQSPAKGIALPTVDEIGPIAFLKPGKMEVGDLPTLMPAEKSPKLTIKLDGEDVVIQSEKEMELRWIRFHLLARWWVNGKPFVPEQTDKFWLSARQGFHVFEKEVRLPLFFEPGLIGAKQGDKISLQVMYCESEWSWCASRLHSHRIDRGNDNLRISNRIEFVAAMKK